MKKNHISRYNPEDNVQIENAIKFLVERISKCGNNPKPVILHSIRVAFNLDTHGYCKDMIIAALLHDIIEDSDTAIDEVGRVFGQRVKKLVASCTFDKKIEDKTKRYKSNFQKAIKTGKESLIIRAADLSDNSNYYHFVKDAQVYQRLLDKLDFFLRVSKKVIGKEEVYKVLLKKRGSLVNFQGL